MWIPNCLEMAGDIQALPTVVTGGGDLLVIISQRAATVTSPAWLADGLPIVLYSSFFIFLKFYSGSNLSRCLSDRRISLTDKRVMAQGCQRTSQISNIFVNYFTGCQKPPKRQVFTFFHWVTSRFRSLCKHGLS